MKRNARGYKGKDGKMHAVSPHHEAKKHIGKLAIDKRVKNGEKLVDLQGKPIQPMTDTERSYSIGYAQCQADNINKYNESQGKLKETEITSKAILAGFGKK